MTRLLIANDLDPWIVTKSDVRAWAQRLLWFAEPGDHIILADQPDLAFIDHVAGAKGFDPSQLTFHVPPGNRYDGRIFDHLALTCPDFTGALSPALREVSEVIAAWPSPHVSAFINRTGLADRWPGARSFAQGTCELFNSKATFRAFATSAGTPIPIGSVCRSVDDAVKAMTELLGVTTTVMVKKAHGGAGTGNHIVTRDPATPTSHSGGKYFTALESVNQVVSFWREHWEWATSGGSYPVIIEQFQHRARSLYAEYWCSEETATLAAIGELHFEARSLTRENIPADVPPSLAEKLQAQSYEVASLYQQLGYRGPLSVDAVVTAGDSVVFTEVNARYTGSTHLWSIFKQLAPDLTITQITTPPHWKIIGLTHFLTAIEESGYAWDARLRRGILAVTPKIGARPTGPVIFALLHLQNEDVADALRDLESALDRAATD